MGCLRPPARGGVEHRREAAAGGAEVGGLALEQARGEQLHPAVVDITTQIELERKLAVRRRRAALAGLDSRLRDILAAKYFLEHPAREFVATIRRLAAVARRRFEEPLLARAPEFLGLLGRNRDRARDAGEQGGDSLWRQAERTQKIRVR